MNQPKNSTLSSISAMAIVIAFLAIPLLSSCLDTKKDANVMQVRRPERINWRLRWYDLQEQRFQCISMLADSAWLASHSIDDTVALAARRDSLLYEEVRAYNKSRTGDGYMSEYRLRSYPYRDFPYWAEPTSKYGQHVEEIYFEDYLTEEEYDDEAYDNSFNPEIDDPGDEEYYDY